MKKALIIFLVIVSVIFIYYVFKDNKIYYASIDLDTNLEYSYQNYIVDYLKEKDVFEKYVPINEDKYRIIDMIRSIEDNKIYDEKPIKNILIKADLLTLKVGHNDLISKISLYNSQDMYKYIEGYLSDLDELLNLLRKNDKERIILIGYYNSYDGKYDYVINYINKRVKSLSSKYNIDFLDIEDKLKYKNSLSLSDNRIIFNSMKNIIDTVIENKK